ncbi:MAG: TIGR00282 family metallophosphoesterase [bacterium]|nr:TIGR00282 family metallophosphoesterase [bacterium]
MNDVIKIVAFGDIIGRPGRRALEIIVPDIRKEYSPNLIIGNGENLAHNEGTTEKTLNEILKNGIDFVTLGDHAFDRDPEMKRIFEKNSYPIIRPANYPPGAIGIGWKIIKVKKSKIAILNLLGRVFFRQIVDCPFRCADIALAEIKKQTNIIICDFHAEATSEKKAMGLYLDGRVSLVYGTHTHIPTADEQILPKKTAYLTDIGMLGPKLSVIGSNPENSIKHFLTQMPFNYEVSEDNNIEVNAIYIEIDIASGKALFFKRIRKFYIC